VKNNVQRVSHVGLLA